MRKSGTGYVPNLGERAMEDDERNVFCFLHQAVDVGEKRVRGLVEGAFDVSSLIIVVSDVHHDVILFSDLIAVPHDFCEFLRRAKIKISLNYPQSKRIHRR